MATVVERNIDTLLELRRQMDQGRTMQDRIADAITAFTGSMAFLYFHVAWFGLWLIINLGLVGILPFDPYPFGLLTMIVSLEAIFLSTFVLISQNRMAAISDERADLDLHIDLLAEYEVTKMLKLADAIADHFHLKEGKDRELSQLEQMVSPDAVLREIQRHKKRMGGLVGPDVQAAKTRARTLRRRSHSASSGQAPASRY